MICHQIARYPYYINDMWNDTLNFKKSCVVFHKTT